MARTRSSIRTLAITAAIAVAVPAAPAAAAGQDIERWPHAVARDVGSSLARGNELEDGPFLPLTAKPDFGSAEDGFGAARSGHVHSGQDVFAPTGTPLVAVTDGVIADAGSDGSQGNYVYLYDPARERTYVYMHMVEPATVRAGDEVEAGERLGGVGCTGSCWGEHLHFEIRDGKGIAGEARDPLPLLRDWHPLDRAR